MDVQRVLLAKDGDQAAIKALYTASIGQVYYLCQKFPQDADKAKTQARDRSAGAAV